MLTCTNHEDNDFCECKQKQWSSLSPKERKMAIETTQRELGFCEYQIKKRPFVDWDDFVKMRELGFRIKLDKKEVINHE